jgi:hypothetical protein
MPHRKTVLFTLALCALLVGAFAAQSASALGTTAHTCTKTGTGTAGKATFSDAHCKTEAVGGAFKHVGIANGTVTETTTLDITTGTEHSGATLKSTVAGSAIELVAKEVSGAGTMSNSLAGEEMILSGTGKLKYSNVTENLLGCKVTGKPGGAGIVETKELALTTAGVGDKVKITPKEGTLFAEFELTECVIGPITIKVFGSVLGVPSGPTINTVHTAVTSEKTLRLQNATTGPVAGIEGTNTEIGREPADGVFTPIAVTT